MFQNFSDILTGVYRAGDNYHSILIFVFFAMKTNLVHNLSLIYCVTQPLHASGVIIAHHQEVFTVYVQQLTRVTCFGEWQLVGSGFMMK
jgi:hypothetical protein